VKENLGMISREPGGGATWTLKSVEFPHPKDSPLRSCSKPKERRLEDLMVAGRIPLCEKILPFIAIEERLLPSISGARNGMEFSVD